MTNVFDLRGPEFLEFYAALTAAAAVAGLAVRTACRGPFGRPARSPVLSPAATAVLAGHGRRLADATVAGLVHAGCLKVDVATRRLRRQLDPDPAATPIARAVATACTATGTRVDGLRAAVRPSTGPLERELQRLDLLTLPGPRATAMAVPLGIAAVVLLVGLTKIGVGASRGRPVGLLVLFCAFDLVVFLALFARVPRRTGRGDAVLRDLRQTSSPLRTSARSAGSRLTDADVVLAVALFGPGGLANGDPQMRDLVTVLQPPASSGGDGGSGSSCSSGSSCGGGGGCGGCGGG